MTDSRPEREGRFRGGAVEGGDKAFKDRSEECCEPCGLGAERGEFGKARKDILPVCLCAEEGHRGNAAAKGHDELKISLQGAHHKDGGGDSVCRGGGTEGGEYPGAEVGIINRLGEELGHLHCEDGPVKGVDRAIAEEDKFLFPRVGNEGRAEGFGMSVYVEGDLGEDREPDIFRAKDQMVVVTVGSDSGTQEAIAGRVNGFAADVGEGGLNHGLELLVVFLADRGTEELLRCFARLGIAFELGGLEFLGAMFCGDDGDGHGDRQTLVRPVESDKVEGGRSKIVDWKLWQNGK